MSPERENLWRLYQWRTKWTWINGVVLVLAVALRPLFPGVSFAFYLLLGITFGLATIAGTNEERLRRIYADAAGFAWGLGFGAAIAYDAGQAAWGWPNPDPFLVFAGLLACNGCGYLAVRLLRQP